MLMEALIERDGMLCTWCGRLLIKLPISPFIDCSGHITVEHLMPLILGGSNELSNLALACFACNNERGCDLDWLYEDLDAVAGRSLL